MNLKAAFSSGGGYAVAAAMVIGLFIGEQATPVDTVGGIASSPTAAACPGGWQETTGNDPHAGNFTACTSPDGRYIMRISDGVKTTLDQESGEFVDSGQFR